jgi:hypothetical protein
LDGKSMIPYLARLPETSFKKCTIPSDWKTATLVPIYKRDNRSAVTNYRPISFTSVVCKHLEHVIAGYLRKVWEKNDWLHEGQHGFRPGYSCVSHHTAPRHNWLDEGVGAGAIIIDFYKAFGLVPHDRLFMKLVASDVDSRVVVWVRNFLVGRTQTVTIGGQLSKEVKLTSGMPKRKRFGPTTLSSIHKWYLKEHRLVY